MRDYFVDPLFTRYLKNLYFAFRDGLPLRFEGSALPQAVNGSLWSLPLEFKCYVALALLGSAGLLYGRWQRIAVMAILVTSITYLVLRTYGLPWPQLHSWVFQQTSALEFGLFFFAGVMFHCIRLDSLNRRARGTLLAVAWLLAAAAWWTNLQPLAIWFALPLTVLLIGLAGTPGLRRAGRFGDFSYGIYIYAFPVQQTVVWLYKERLDWSTALLLVIVVTLVLAAASWHLIEKQALKLKPRAKPPAVRQTTVIEPA